VPGIGPKTFEQAAGFLRIRHGENPLDMTAVHPESYHVVEQIAEGLKVPIGQLIREPALLAKVDKSGLAAGVYTLNDILEELRKPGRDPRDQFVAPGFKDDVKEIGDLQEGMQLEGVVTNVTKFGAFVDVGVHQDGLVHISELSDRYVKEPGEVVKVGQIVKVRVLSADANTKRIALSMKTPGPKPGPGAAPQPGKRPPTKPQPTMEDKLAVLADRWKRR
jgi:protein Tex